jgi:hypothetical protein
VSVATAGLCSAVYALRSIVGATTTTMKCQPGARATVNPAPAPSAASCVVAEVSACFAYYKSARAPCGDCATCVLGTARPNKNTAHARCGCAAMRSIYDLELHPRLSYFKCLHRGLTS